MSFPILIPRFRHKGDRGVTAKVPKLVLDAIIDLVLHGEPKRTPSDFGPADAP
jgi:hypothetical protein